MKRAFPSLPFTLSPLILAAAIGAASVVKADNGLPHPGFEITQGDTALLII